ncbi:hypothetical protein SAMD00019534_105520 [Acytostelium subglobosum LB1]|uniref:hypothetical protein n=1 Tax=Acytostelium subglobosum LB1 TaxID=1410327 RepID=UPI0006450B22|nr:hypothetical protein SAMD00019534_105520 [Acytostelium subglobosum LB1]GAM27377.1 hypothetical protein SAMD00019534_105520 [Acytostelium subglobosum LB1]|eukprot:XP_012749844.1 hypothetical protein SAMD00019534_105520 [Acytostelium subglobosum LB1]
MFDIPEEVTWAILVAIIIYLIKTIWFTPPPPVVAPRPKPVYEKRDYTLEELAGYTGIDETNAIFIAIKGRIFDVSPKRSTYGPGGDYHVFAGHDATRCLAKASFEKSDLNQPDTSSLTPDELDALNNWASFFEERYILVGKVKPSSSE